MSSAPPPHSGPRLGSLALVLAWLIFLGVLAAAVAYVLVASRTQVAEGEGRPAATLRLQVEPEPAMEEPAIEPPAERVAEAEPPPAPPVPTPPSVAEEPEAAQPAAEAEAEPPAPEPEPEMAEAAPTDEQQAALPRAVPPEAMPLWQRNSQPFDQSETRPRIAIVLSGLGFSSAATEAAIKQLPPGITLSFTPYSRRLNEFVALARVNGHEVMLDLAMEPTSYPDDDPGPHTLLTALSPAQNLERLDWALGRTSGYVGVAALMGSRFTTSEDHLAPVLEEIKARGLVFLDNRASEKSVAGGLAAKIGLPSAISDRFLDRAQASRVAIDARLIQLERIARTEGQAIAIGRPYPVTIERLREWSKDLDTRGMVLAPISAVIKRERPRTAAARGAVTE